MWMVSFYLIRISWGNRRNVRGYRTSSCAKQAIVLYEYQPTRKAEHAEAFLKGFSGWLHADGYQGYLYFDVLPWLNLFLRFCDDWR